MLKAAGFSHFGDVLGFLGVWRDSVNRNDMTQKLERCAIEVTFPSVDPEAKLQQQLEQLSQACQIGQK